MTAASARPSSSLLSLSALALLCIIAVTVRVDEKSVTNDNRPATARPMRGTVARSKNTIDGRRMVGGYSAMDWDLLKSEEVMEIANFALGEHAGGSSGFGDSGLVSLAVTPEEVGSGAARVQVLEAQRQVVAGLNYKLTLAVLKDKTCLGAMKVTVYKPLPHMEQGLTVTSWGKGPLGCNEVEDLLEAVRGKEEENAMAAEGEMEEVRQEARPDA